MHPGPREFAQSRYVFFFFCYGQKEEKARRAYYFPPRHNQIQNNFRILYGFGAPGTTKDAYRPLPPGEVESGADNGSLAALQRGLIGLPFPAEGMADHSRNFHAAGGIRW